MIVTLDNLEGLVKTNLVRVSIENCLDKVTHTDIINSVEECKQVLLEEHPEVIGMESSSQECVSKIYTSLLHKMYNKGYSPVQSEINKSFEYLMNRSYEYQVYSQILVDLVNGAIVDYEDILLELLEGADILSPEETLLHMLKNRTVGFNTRKECVDFALQLISQQDVYGVLIYRNDGEDNIYDGCVVRWED